MTVLPHKVYRAQPGGIFTDKDAAIIGPAIESLADGEGYPSTEMILDAARNPESPLHRYFEWDQAEAAHKYNLEQARYLARSWRIEVVYEKRGEQTTYLMPGMVNLRVGSEGKRAYIPINDVLETPELLAQAKADAEKQARYWYARFGLYRKLEPFRQLEPMFQAIESTFLASE